jgi:VIT1/CCC1 family predicted Fe2+/Mn2+ transporter
VIDTNTEKFFGRNDDPHTKNKLLLQSAMEAMYSTFITDEYVAEGRGEAIQALDRFYLRMTGERLIPMFEGGGPKAG